MDAQPSPSPSAAMLRVRDLRVGFEGDAPLIAHWRADIGPGLTLLHGDTGSGKSAVLRVLAGEAPALGGQLTLGPATLPGAQAAWRQQRFYMDPATRDFDTLTVQACVQQLRAAAGGWPEPHWQALAEAFSLTPHLHKGMHMLSTGSRRKVFLSCALASQQALILLDEPTAALDAASIRALKDALHALAQAPQRIVIVASGGDDLGLPWRQRLALPMPGAEA